MKISARLIVALFCATLVINPIILLSLFSKATNDAIFGVVSLWDSSVLHSLESQANARLNSLKDIMSMAAVDVAFVAKSYALASELSSPTYTPFRTNVSFIVQQQRQILEEYSSVANDLLGLSNRSDGSVTINLVVAERVNGSDLHRVVLFPNSHAISGTSGLPITVPSKALLDGNVTRVMFKAPLVSQALNQTTRNVMPNTGFDPMVSIREFYGRCSSAAAIFNDLLVLAKWASQSETQQLILDAASGALLSSTVWAVAPIDANFTMFAFVSPAEQTNFSCPLIPSFSSNSTVSAVVAQTSFLSNVAIFTGSSTATFPAGIGTGVVAGSSLMKLLLGPNIVSRVLLPVPLPQAVALVALNPVDRTSWQVVSCMSSGTSYCSDVTATVTRVPPATLLDAMSFESMTFVEVDSQFITVVPLDAPLYDYDRVTPLLPVQPSVFLLLAVPSSSSRSLMSSAVANSVIVSVTVTAFVFVVTLTVLHNLFHPLKVVGTLLRCCADIRLHDVEEQAPSAIVELRQLQIAVDHLVSKIRVIGKYMPDKSQLHSVLNQEEDLKTFEKNAMANEGGKLSFQGKSQMLGEIAHSVSVRVEYRSRRRPDKERKAEKSHKHCAFEFVYTAQEQIYDTLMQQIRERLGERIGEALQLLDKRSNRSHVSVKESVPLHSTEDVLDAIERSADRSLHLMVLKMSAKNYWIWLHAVVSVADVAMLLNVSLYFLSTSTATSATARNSYVSRAGIAMLLLVALRLALNIAVGMYLTRRFATISSTFSKWASAALQETLVGILLSSTSIHNLAVIFSHTRLTKELRFNAPFSELFRPIIFRWYCMCLIVSDVVPLALTAYCVAQLRSFDWSSFVAIVLMSISILMFAFDNFFDKIVFRMKIILSGQSGFGVGASRGEGRGILSRLWNRPKRTLSRSSAGSSSQWDDDFDEALLGTESQSSPQHHDDDDDYATELSSVKRSNATSTLHHNKESDGGGSDTQQGSKSLYLGLSVREATILKISFLCASAFFDAMDAVEIQALCSSFLSIAFNEAKLCGGMVLNVSNGEVTIGFNCHQLQDTHLEKAIGCFFRVQQEVLQQKKLARWSEDFLLRPKLVGAIVSGPRYTIGFSGCGETRTFQLIGKAKRELTHVFRIGSFYGITLAVNRTAAERIEADDLQSLLSTMPSALYRSPSMMDDDDLVSATSFAMGGNAPSPLMVRLVEVVQVPLPPAVVGKASKSPQRLLTKKRFGSGGRHVACTFVFEVLNDLSATVMLNSSQPALGFLGAASEAKTLKGGASNALESSVSGVHIPPGTTSEDKVPEKGSQGVHPAELIRSHLSVFPNDVLMKHVLKRVMCMPGPTRPSSSLGVDIGPFERPSLGDGEPTTSPGSRRDDDDHGLASRNSVFAKICASNHYVLYFTDV